MQSVCRLEQLLAVWERNWLVSQALSATILRDPRNKLIGPIVSWPEFRTYLLGALDQPEFDHRRFLPPNLGLFEPTWGSCVLYYPRALHAWTRDSRRVYHMSAELVHLLNLTSLKDIMWDQVPWPFRSFAVTLEIPLVGEDGTLYDCILVSREFNHVTREYVIAFRFLPKSLDTFVPSSPMEKERIQTAIRNGDQRVMASIIRKHNRLPDGQPVVCSVFYVEEKHGNVPIVTNVDAFVDQSEQHAIDGFKGEVRDRNGLLWNVGARLVLGLCLYLRSLGKKSTGCMSPWQRLEPGKAKGADQYAVTRAADVCTVTSVHHFTPEEQHVLERAGLGARALVELRAHFREGHWRRPPGRGSDPDADYSVQVLPTIVRRDRLPEGGLPGGTEKIIH